MSDFIFSSNDFAKLKEFINMTKELSDSKEWYEDRMLDYDNCCNRAFFLRELERIAEEKQKRDILISDIETIFGL